ncbi:DUF4179 domain-containing protein [Paenibacillus alvei]|uniref:DUF4179 domain-containing protein n=1 Tax=Paenibacillus alvei TaxID=44250 RepID=A0ABT4H279_PAEAL|nr:DUF4179 domain-containing protein [Paenibacillus alvei]EJW16471.1 hypothetical protein PAV_5c00500 [Paenibacillus alvei DSM 29]MCY7485980.1 DUF4179 domain-containing protein [Paenibacillus alvei]MCY9542438.1 DUF4179 domain-containing protein [Paenibacillus alvei]MCY9704290.1 DUF4179 domain-containing protein [Paenibacillus alvei]MCY9756545.1 DUF4179 domain-containing protein [Paenibacillus alvei]
MSTYKQSLLKKMIAVTCLTAVLGTGAGAASVDLPAASAAASGSSVFQKWGGPGLKAASKKGLTTVKDAKATKDGVTLSVPELMFDGLRLVMVLKSEGEENPLFASKSYLVNGQPLQVDKLSMMASSVPVEKGKENNMCMIEFTNAIDPKTGEPILPNEFELTINAKFEAAEVSLVIPVKNISKRDINIQPNTKKSTQKFNYEVTSLRMTDATTLLQIHSKGEIPSSSTKRPNGYHQSKMYYEIVDDKGKVLEQSMLSIYAKKPEKEYNEKILYAPSASATKFIIVKPYTLFVNKNGMPLEDKKRNMIKDYHKALEIKIPVTS